MKHSKAAMGFIFITLLIDVIGLGIIIPVLPGLIMELTGSGLSEASTYGGLLLFIYAFFQFIFAPIIGALSDKYGRRPVLLASLLGFGLDYLVLALAPDMSWLIIGRIIAGILGASFTTASAYIADISPPEKRAQNFGMIGAAFGLGFIIGPVIGGLLGQYGTRIPFYAAAVLSLINALYGFFVLPESLPKEKRRPFEIKRANPIGNLKQLRKSPILLGLSLSLLFLYIASHAVQSTWTYFTMYRFDWDEAMVGYSLGVVGILSALVQGGLIRWFIPKFGQKLSIYIGIGFYTVGLLLFAFATEGWMMLVFLIPYCLGGISGPALQGIMAGQVKDNEQGELQGAMTSLMSLTSIIGPPLMTGVFAYFTSGNGPIHLPGAPMLIGTVLCIIGWYFSFRTLQKNNV
ncbi:MAG: DHA1 family tetracycline resistance protein-like MFS transporter [Luteibaculaceae bacterium]|jgi:DHA1 family tetracycline resistance protein-like MFS transporter